MLKSVVPDPIPIAAGADRFQKVLISKLSRAQDSELRGDAIGTRQSSSILNAPGSLKLKDESNDGNTDFALTKSRMVHIGSDFVAQGLAAQDRIASFGSKLIRDGTTVVVPCHSVLVANLLLNAAGIEQNTSSDRMTSRKVRKAFRAIFVVDEDWTQDAPSYIDWKSFNQRLRTAGYPTTSVKSTQLANVLSALPRSLDSPSIFSWKESAQDFDAMTAVDFPPSQTILLTGVPALFASGGVLASTKVHNAARMANSCGREVWVAAENNTMVKDITLAAQVDGHRDAPPMSGGLGCRPEESSSNSREEPAEEMGMIVRQFSVT